MAALAIAPDNPVTIASFGKGDDHKLRLYLLMTAAFLEQQTPNTRRSYQTGIRQFFEAWDWICPEDVTPGHIVAYKKHLLEERKLSHATVCNRMAALTSYFNFLCTPAGAMDDPLIKYNPCSRVSCKDIQPTPYARSKSMEWETFQSLLEATPVTPIGLRDKAILLFFAFTGRRRAEVARLRVRDLDLRSRPRTYTVLTKGNHEKKFELPDLCYDAIRAYWIAADRLNGMKPEDAVFAAVDQPVTNTTAVPNGPLNYRTMAKVLESAARRAGVDGLEEVHLHAIRHMAARDLDKAGISLQDIQAFLGHASPTTTMIYLDRLVNTARAHTDVLLRVRQAAADLGRAAIAETG
jgi:integrase